MLADSSLDRMHLLCPDPWPKDKHKHHRLLCSDFMAQIHRVLKKNACFHFATDEDRYFEAAGRLLDNCGLFVRDDSTIDDVRDIKTDFEIRWNEQGKIVHHGSWKALK
jgi:tRNA (guanine-N7-)-methyltransferase